MFLLDHWLIFSWPLSGLIAFIICIINERELKVGDMVYIPAMLLLGWLGFVISLGISWENLKKSGVLDKTIKKW